MADTTDKTTTQPTDDRTQSSIDSSFFEQMGVPSTGGADVSTMLAYAYIDSNQRTGDWLRNVVGLQHLAKSFAPVVATAVIDRLKNDPILARQLADASRR